MKKPHDKYQAVLIVHPMSTHSLKLDWDTSDPECVIVRLAGRLDLDEAQVLEAEVLTRSAATSSHLCFDMAGVLFMSSSGIRSLVSIRRRMEQIDRKLVLFALTPNVLKILQIVEIDHLFHICDRQDTAIQTAKK
ncbi:MAG: STAS domain-containing protein [Leptospiraceae bacterium]|nr:STAS domain-containing protein [Leptospiraceae bacterium]